MERLTKKELVRAMKKRRVPFLDEKQTKAKLQRRYMEFLRAEEEMAGIPPLADDERPDITDPVARRCIAIMAHQRAKEQAAAMPAEAMEAILRACDGWAKEQQD